MTAGANALPAEMDVDEIPALEALGDAIVGRRIGGVDARERRLGERQAGSVDIVRPMSLEDDEDEKKLARSLKNPL